MFLRWLIKNVQEYLSFRDLFLVFFRLFAAIHFYCKILYRIPNLDLQFPLNRMTFCEKNPNFKPPHIKKNLDAISVLLLSINL